VTRRLLPSAGSLGRLSLLHRYYVALRRPLVLPAPLCSSLCSAVPGLSPRRRGGLPGSWRTLVLVPCP